MKVGFVVLVAALAVAGAVSASAQQSTEVSFAPGDYGTMLSGSITGHEYADYRLGVREGQELFAELTVSGGNGNGTAYFNVLPPGSDGVAIFNGSMENGNSSTIKLPESGTYTIRVYLMGNDRDADRTVDYNLDVSIQ